MPALDLRAQLWDKVVPHEKEMGSNSCLFCICLEHRPHVPSILPSQCTCCEGVGCPLFYSRDEHVIEARLITAGPSPGHVIGSQLYTLGQWEPVGVNWDFLGRLKTFPLLEVGHKQSGGGNPRAEAE